MKIDQLDTPHLTIDLDATERNITRAQSYCDKHRFRFRPHIKSHKMPAITRMQLAAGAVGITCQKIGEAEIMADAEVEDILLTYPPIGDHKADRLAELAARCVLSVAADSANALECVSKAGKKAGREIGFLVECDTGGGRLGVQTPTAALALATEAANSPGVRFMGLMTFPTSSGTRPFMEEAAELLEARGLPPEVISGGGTPTLYQTHELGGVNEVRAGEYVFADRAKYITGLAAMEDLAARVIATVVSRPTADRAIIDAGSKSLAMDPLERVDIPGTDGFGLVVEYPDAVIYELSEEHGHLDLRNCKARPRVGDLVTVVPNHVCPCVNLHELVALHREGNVEEIVPIAARGKIR